MFDAVLTVARRFPIPPDRSAGRHRRGSVLGPAALVLAVALSACDTGQNASTARETPDVAGVAGSVGQIRLDDVFIASGGNIAAGASAPLRGTFTNEAGSADRLLGVSTPAATSVVELDGAAPSAGGISLPPQTQVDAVNGAPQLRLEEVRSPITITQLVPVTFTFRTAGSVTLDVPVATRSGTTPAPRARTTA